MATSYSCFRFWEEARDPVLRLRLAALCFCCVAQISFCLPDSNLPPASYFLLFFTCSKSGSYSSSRLCRCRFARLAGFLRSSFFAFPSAILSAAHERWLASNFISTDTTTEASSESWSSAKLTGRFLRACAASLPFFSISLTTTTSLSSSHCAFMRWRLLSGGVRACLPVWRGGADEGSLQEKRDLDVEAGVPAHADEEVRVPAHAD